MANSYVEYTGDGVQTDFAFDKPYIDEDNVKVSVNFVDTAFEWLSSSLVRVSPAPANGATVKVYRETPKTALVTFSNSSNLTAENLTLAETQSLYIAIEADDVASSTTGASEDAGALAAQAYDTANEALETAEDTIALAEEANLAAQQALDIVEAATGVGAIGTDSIENETALTGLTLSTVLENLDEAIDLKADASALAAKADAAATTTALAGKANTSHTHAISDTTGLQAALDGKAASSHAHTVADTTGLQTILDAKQATSQKGVANGYASLGSDGKVPSGQLPTPPADGQPIPTTSTYAVGTLILARNTYGGTINDGDTIAGSYLQPVCIGLDTSTGCLAPVTTSATLSGSWKNVSGFGVNTLTGTSIAGIGYFVRYA